MSTKYEFTGETIDHFGATLRRVRAVVAIAELGVLPGDVGGYVESVSNLSQIGDAWVSGDARVCGNASKDPLVISGLHWKVTITDSHMRIGCQFHALDEWAGFDDAKIVEMGGKDALRFWRANKDFLLGLARASGREF